MQYGNFLTTALRISECNAVHLGIVGYSRKDIPNAVCESRPKSGLSAFVKVNCVVVLLPCLWTKDNGETHFRTLFRDSS